MVKWEFLCSRIVPMLMRENVAFAGNSGYKEPKIFGISDSLNTPSLYKV